MNQGSGREEADGEPLLAGRQTETEGDMGLAGSAVAERDDILTTLDVFASRQLQNQHLVERCDGLEVEAVEAFDGGEPGLSDPPLDHAALTVDQFQLGQTDKIPHMVGALGGAVAGQLVVFAQERRQFQGLEVMGQQHLRRIGHDAPPPNKLIITGGGRGRHVGPRQVGIDIQVEFGRASLDTAQHKVFDGVVADRTPAQGVVSQDVV